MLTAATWNFVTRRETHPIAVFNLVGSHLRIISSVFPLDYMNGIRDLNVAGVTSRPVFACWPPYNPKARMQGFNLFTAEGRREAVLALANLRHNLHCDCPVLAK